MSFDPDVIDTTIEKLARTETGRLTAALLRVFGGGRLAFVEDCLQDAFASALIAWRTNGVPKEPFAWLLTTARNRAIDRLRHTTMAAALEPRLVEWVENLSRPIEATLGDEELTLLVMCSNPVLEVEARIALMLKSVSGFTVAEIARAFLVKPETLAQRLVRAKSRIRDLNLEFELPSGSALLDRMPSVLKVVYLMFNEGYAPSEGDAAVRQDVCCEALRIARVIVHDSRTSTAEAWALMALIAFQHSRRAARQTAEGSIVLLPNQDRALWDHALIAEGLTALKHAMKGETLTSLHLEAGIASTHAVAPNWHQTNWDQMISYYDSLMEIAPSSVAAVNRAVAISMRDGPAKGLLELKLCGDDKAMRAYPPFFIAQADMLAKCNDLTGALDALRATQQLTISAPERRIVDDRMHKIQSELPQEVVVPFMI